MSRQSIRLEVIPVDRLRIDPDVQFDFALQERRWRHIGAHWDPFKAGVLQVTPNGGDIFDIFDGRHRYLGGKEIAGVKEFRCDVHRPGLSAREKAERKLAMDRDRRSVKAVESFLASVIAEEPEALAIQEIVSRHGYVIGKSAGRGVDTTIEGVSMLGRIHRAGYLDRVMSLNTLWFGQPKTVNSAWIGALGDFCSNSWDVDLSQAQRERLADLIPAVVWRKAVADSTTTSRSSAHGGMVARLISEQLRKTARVRKATT